MFFLPVPRVSRFTLAIVDLVTSVGTSGPSLDDVLWDMNALKRLISVLFSAPQGVMESSKPSDIVAESIFLAEFIARAWLGP